jgi:hypothetical protein
MKAKRRMRKKRSRNVWVYAFALILITLIAIYAVREYLNVPSPTVNPPKKDAAEYFGFSEIGAEGDRVASDIIRVRTLHFGITPKEGNATHLNLFASGMTAPSVYADLSLPMNKTFDVDLQMDFAVQIKRQGSVYPITIKLVSAEAEGNVTLDINESSFYPL